MNFVYFIALVGVLIFVHELGHFVWAKAFGVKVLRFSLGFGPRIAGFRVGETDYVVAALPLGGYVRMLGEGGDDPIEEGDEGRSFPEQALWQRIIIVIGGPAMNLLFPVLLFFVVFLGDRWQTPATIGTVIEGGAAAEAGLEAGDRVVEADGRSIRSYYELARLIGSHAEQELELVVEDRQGEERRVRVTPDRAREPRELDLVQEVGRIGILPHFPLAIVGLADPEGPAAVAGLATFDRVIAAGRQPVDRWIDLSDALDANPGATLPVTFLRPMEVAGSLGGLAEVDVYDPRVTQLTPDPGRGEGPERAGLELADLYVSHVLRDAPELAAGLRPRDRIRRLDGEEVESWLHLERSLLAGGLRPHRLAWTRGDQRHEAEVRLATLPGDPALDRAPQPVLGMRHWVPTRVDEAVPNPRPVGYAMDLALRRSWEMVELTVVSVVRLLQGRLSVRTIGGPISILEVTGQAAAEGALNFLAVMAFVSINLGLINLLPVPLLDGGHLLFFLIEAVARRPLSLRVRQYASAAGLTVLVLLVVLSFKNDIERRWPDIVETLQSAEP